MTNKMKNLVNRMKLIIREIEDISFTVDQTREGLEEIQCDIEAILGALPKEGG